MRRGPQCQGPAGSESNPAHRRWHTALHVSHSTWSTLRLLVGPPQALQFRSANQRILDSRSVVKHWRVSSSTSLPLNEVFSQWVSNNHGGSSELLAALRADPLLRGVGSAPACVNSQCPAMPTPQGAGRDPSCGCLQARGHDMLAHHLVTLPWAKTGTHSCRSSRFHQRPPRGPTCAWHLCPYLPRIPWC